MGGGGQGGLEFVIPGRVCGRNAVPGIGGSQGGSRRTGPRSGFSGTRPKKKSRQGAAGHSPAGGKVSCSWGPRVGIHFEGLGLGLGLRPSAPSSPKGPRGEAETIGLVQNPSLASVREPTQ